jgi:hypothetical protein
LKKQGEEALIEEVGANLRKMFAWK